MKIRWTERALSNLASIHAFVSGHSPAAAQKLATTLLQSAWRLEQFPQSGREGRLHGTREVVVSGLPYILAYRTLPDIIEILAVIHTSRQWPEKL